MDITQKLNAQSGHKYLSKYNKTCLNRTQFVQYRQVFGLHRFKLHRHLVDGTVKSVWFTQGSVYRTVKSVWFTQGSVYRTVKSVWFTQGQYIGL